MNKHSHSIKTIILIGPPGSGKGTLCHSLSDHPQDFSGKIISLGFLLRQETLAKTPLGLRIEAETKDGNFLSGDLVEQIIEKELTKYHHENIIFDGFPRIPSQQSWLERTLPRFHRQVDHVILLKIDTPKILERLSRRQTCLFCNYVGLSMSSLDQGASCPQCQNILVTRSDDNEAAILKRIENYDNFTKKMIQEKYCNKIFCIDTDTSPQNIYKQFIKQRFFDYVVN